MFQKKWVFFSGLNSKVILPSRKTSFFFLCAQSLWVVKLFSRLFSLETLNTLSLVKDKIRRRGKHYFHRIRLCRWGRKGMNFISILFFFALQSLTVESIALFFVFTVLNVNIGFEIHTLSRKCDCRTVWKKDIRNNENPF